MQQDYTDWKGWLLGALVVLGILTAMAVAGPVADALTI